VESAQPGCGMIALSGLFLNQFAPRAAEQLFDETG
jgi:hypothetical protein